MNFPVSRLVAISAFALASVVGSARSPAQNAYITNVTSNNVSVIDTATDTAIGSPIPVESEPHGVAVTPDGSKVYVANSGDNSVSVIDASKNVVTVTIPVGESPFAFGIFMQPAPRFVGTPGFSNCHGKSVAALAQKFGGLNGAAAALGTPTCRRCRTPS